MTEEQTPERLPIRDGYTFIGKSFAIDNFLPQKNGSHRNFPQYVKSPVVEEWAEPSDHPMRSGKEFVRTEDGKLYFRYDCYVVDSPYGWEEAGKSKFS